VKQKAYLGIDPGNTGCIAIIPAKGKIRSFYTGEKVETDFWDWFSAQQASEVLEHWGQQCILELCGLERVWGRPGQNVKTTSMLMENFGTWKGILSALDVPFAEVLPKEWQQIIQDEPGKDSKKKSLSLARKLFSDVPLNLEKYHNRADSLNIALYVKRMCE
jgi:Holliday junction resolvasome RuvABC endonuclease subunit